MDRIEGDPAAGIAHRALSASKYKKLMAAAGATLLIAGIVGMVVTGAGAIYPVTTGGFSDPGEGKSIQLTVYVFLFTLLAGLVVMLYSLVGLQRDKAKARESQRVDSKSENHANAA
jgi:uncharacterized membrane protein